MQADLQLRAVASDASRVVLVEGLSDYFAITILAARCGRATDHSSTVVVPMGGATNIRRFLEQYGPPGRGASLLGLCDLAEERFFAQCLEDAGLGRNLDRRGMEALGFFVCENDLEHEMIRTLGCDTTERVIEEQGELRSLRKMQRDPFHRERTHEQHLHRFMGVRSGRKYRYARLLAEALDLDSLPTPLAALLDRM